MEHDQRWGCVWLGIEWDIMDNLGIRMEEQTCIYRDFPY